MLCVLVVSVGQVFSQKADQIRQQDPISLSGTLSLTTAFTRTTGIDPRQPPVSYVLTGSPVLRIYGIDLPFGFLLSNYQRNFNQPFNKFGVSPTYKDYTLHLGYRNVSFSPFTLSGRTFCGAGIEATPGLLRLGFVYGRFQKAVEELSGSNEPGIADLAGPALRRTGYSVRLGVGTDQNYLDVILLKGRDDESSLPGTDIKAEENAAFGLSTRLILARNLTFTGDLGASVYTRDLAQDELLTGDYQLPVFFTRLISPRISSQIGFAGTGKLVWSGKGYTLDATYRRIDPGYKTMGAFYFQTDVEQYLGGITLQTANHQWMIRASAGLERDNIRENRMTQTTRSIGQVYAAWQPGPGGGISLQYSNFGITQTPGLKSISDTTLLRNINQNLVIQPRYLVRGSTFQHMFNGLINYADLSDRSDQVSVLTQMRSFTTQATYSLSWIPSGLTATAGFNRINSQIPAGETISQGIIMGLTQSLLQHTVQVNLSFTAQANQLDGQAYGHTHRLMASLQYRLESQHLFRIQIYRLVNESDQAAVSKSFNEAVLKLTYTYRFNTTRK